MLILPGDHTRGYLYRSIFCLNRKEGREHDEFREYWTTSHAVLGDDIPNVVKYTVSFPVKPNDSPYVSMATLFYDTSEALQESFTSGACTEVVADGPSFADRTVLQLVVEENVPFDAT